MPAPEAFVTNRISAERLAEAHLEALAELHLDPEVMRYVGGVRTPETTRAYLAANIEHWNRHGFGLWVLRGMDGAFMGRAGVRHITVEGEPEIEIAYTLARSYWGQGLASEIADALTGMGLHEIGASSLVAVISTGNIASRRVAEKQGYRFERPVTYYGDGCVLYRLTPPKG